MNSEEFSKRQELEQKKAGWEEKIREVELLADGLGLGVDEGIKETVAAFQLCDVNTTGSHEGKIDRHPAPYIDVMSPDTDLLYKNLFQSNNEQEKIKIREEITKLNLEERKKIKALLEEFYLGRINESEARLFIEELALGWSRVQSRGANAQENEKDEAVIREKLDAFKEEMRLFTEFLKSKYFSSTK
ncbi:MAG: hypothetical protein WCO09_04665 [bacterium]